MDSHIFDDDITDIMQDLERSQGEVELAKLSLERAMDVYLGLTEMVKQGDGLSTESFEKLVSPTYRLAFSGMGVECENLSTESMVETVKMVAKAVMEAIRRFFNNLMDMLANFDVAATWMTQQCNLLERKRITSIGRTPKDRTVKMGRNHRHLRVGRIFPDDAVKLASELTRLKGFINVVNKDFTPGLVSGAGAVGRVSVDLHDDKLSQALISAVESVNMTRIATQLHMRGVDSSRFGRANVLGTSPFVGGSSMFYLQGNLVEKGTRALRFHGFVFDTTSREAYKVDDSHEFRTISPAEMSGFPEVLRDILTLVSKGSSDGVRIQMKNIRASLEREVNSRMGDKDATDEDMRMIRNTVDAFTSWSRVPAQVYGVSMSVVRASLSYAQLSVRNWE